ncbi:EAL domain-containing protein [Pseudoalteromonas sp. G4]|uniref:EAL domain-containing protein n=1 Tax=Pseudoalteromonas sp. G4 TaxID=2992761 RepID=UPI00237D33C5|nr:EAL domain-containing protein [Pseudoalteromonas sp. G4]MDE3271520.1 EAL domain-containing protein [Pseudoalteromonas sp. G4]
MFLNQLNKLGLKSQITWLSAFLIIITATLLTANYWLTTADYVEQQLKQQIHFAHNVLQQNLKQQEQVLITSANVLTADFGFKQAVATLDTKTLQSALLNHSQRIKADLMVLVDLNGEFIASNDQTHYTSKLVQEHIKSMPFKTAQAQILSIQDNVYQIILVPVKAPRTIGYAIIGFRFDQSTLRQLRELLSLDISFISGKIIFQSSLSESSLANENLMAPNQQGIQLLLSSAKFFHQTIELKNTQNISVVLSASLQQIHSDFKRLVVATIIATLLILIFAISFSRVLSKRVTHPLKKLMGLTKGISAGNFVVPKVEGSFPNELAKLYQDFEVMSNAIKQREQKITYQAERDLLTGLNNRYKTLSDLNLLFSQNIQIAVINFNIKGFKTLNDTIGTVNGDKILQEIAKRLNHYKKLSQSSEYTLLSRLHADEFLIAINISNVKQINNIITQLRNELERPFYIDEIVLSLQLYYGIANSIEHGNNSEKLIRRASMAASNAVKNNSTLLFYQDGDDEAYLYKLNLIEELKEALEQDGSNLFLNYQPKLNLKTKKVDKAEALIRWINKEGEFVNPELFVALAEQSGLIVTLTQWVIRQAVMQISLWNEQQFSLNVSINLSAQDIQHEQFVYFLLETTAEYGVDPSNIILELTERDIADNEALVVSRLTHLKSLGFEISVDDYGIGQSSLAKLKNLPVDELKIDKCFILKLDESQEDQDIVASTIALGHKLGLRVVAEGVENLASLELLKQFNCDYIQGYYLAKPLKAEQLTQWYFDYVSAS